MYFIEVLFQFILMFCIFNRLNGFEMFKHYNSLLLNKFSLIFTFYFILMDFNLSILNDFLWFSICFSNYIIFIKCTLMIRLKLK